MLRYTLKTLFRRKKELIVSIAALTLCVLLVTAAIGTVISIKKSISMYTDYNYGSFRAIQPTDSPKNAELGIYGSIISEKSIFDGQLTVGYASSEALPIRLTSGRLPEKTGEAAVEASLGQALMTEISIGEKLDITVMTAEGEPISVTLTVVGFTESTSRLSVKDGDRYLIPSVLVTEGSIKCCPEIYSVITDGNIGEGSLINPRFSDMVMV